jgi:hypothetical protein
MPQTRSARRAALFKEIGDDVMTHILSTVSFADRGSIRVVCQRWRKIVASTAFRQARRAIGETGLVVVGSPCFLIADGRRVLRGAEIAALPGRLRCAVLGEEIVAVGSAVEGVSTAAGTLIDEPSQCHMKALDVSRGTWRNLAAPPVEDGAATASVENPSFAVVAGRLICAGGSREGPLPDDLSDRDDAIDDYMIHHGPPPSLPCGVYEYDTAADAWRECESMTLPVQEASHAVVGNKLYVIGGLYHDEDIEEEHKWVQIPVVQCFDADTNTWRVDIREDVAPHACAHAAAIEGKIYISGGISSGRDQRWVLVFDTEDNACSAVWPAGEGPERLWAYPGEFPDNGPPLFQCPSGCLDGRYVSLDRHMVLQRLEEDGSWTALAQLPGEFRFPAMASHVPLI